jgi:D-aminopeptidase
VGHVTLRKGSVCTGVTAVLPHRDTFQERVMGSGFVLNGSGEISGLMQVMEWGVIETPILLTNTMSVGTVSEAVVRHLRDQHQELQAEEVIIPIVGECDDSWLNDAAGQHVTAEHVAQAIESAKSGPVQEGCVGGGTGMICCDFKGGIGTASRKLSDDDGGYTVGILVMTNFGEMRDLRVDGIPVGRMIEQKYLPKQRRIDNYGSIIVVLATDAPLLQHQIARLCKRSALGVGLTGSYAAHGSGEIMIGFSTANRIPRDTDATVVRMDVMLNSALNTLYEATIEATHEAIINALFAAETTSGRDGHTSPELPQEIVSDLVQSVYRLAPIR